jgi:hypothetical protein
MLFDGVQQPKNGELIPDLTRYGLGLEIRRDVLKTYAAHGQEVCHQGLPCGVQERLKTSARVKATNRPSQNKPTTPAVRVSPGL